MKLPCIFLIFCAVAYGQFEKQPNYLYAENPGDLYLVSQYLILMSAFDGSPPPSVLETQTPLSYLSQFVTVQKEGDIVYFWNNKTGRVILIIPLDIITAYYQDIVRAYISKGVILDYVFNDLLGINHNIPSKSSLNLYNSLGVQLSEIFGIEVNAAGLFNMHGLQLFQQDLLPGIFVTSNLPGGYYDMTDIRKLAAFIGSTSQLIDIAARWNYNYVLQDSAYNIITAEGYEIGNLIGNKDLAEQLSPAITALLESLSETDFNTLADNILTSIALDLPMIKDLPLLFGSITQYSPNSEDDSDTTEVPEDEGKGA